MPLCGPFSRVHGIWQRVACGMWHGLLCSALLCLGLPYARLQLTKDPAHLLNVIVVAGTVRAVSITYAAYGINRLRKKVEISKKERNSRKIQETLATTALRRNGRQGEKGKAL